MPAAAVQTPVPQSVPRKRSCRNFAAAGPRDSAIRNDEKGHMKRGATRGFSLIEMMVVVTLILIVSSIAMMGIQPALQASRVNSAYNTTIAAIRQTRDYAVAQRQVYTVTFNNAVAPNTITITQAGNGNVVTTYQLPTDVSFEIIAGMPTAGNAVPDGFGAGNVAIDFDQNIPAGVKNVIYFQPDGTAQDVSGNLNNGVLYIGRGTDLYSSHAITVWGATGRLRGWKLYKVGVVPYWSQS